MTQELGENFGAFRAQAFERRSRAVPTGKIKARLGPRKHPWNRPQIIKRRTAGAASGTRSDARVFQGIDRSGMAVKIHESRRVQKSLVSLAAPCGELLKQARIGIARGFCASVFGGRRCHRGHEQLGVIGCRTTVRVFLRDGFSLLGHAKSTAKRTVRQCFHEPMRGTRTTANRTATTMEKNRTHRMLVANG